METFNLLLDEVDSLGACSTATLRSVDLLPRFANYLSIALDTVEVRFENSGEALQPFQEKYVSDCRHFIADAVEFHETHGDDYGTEYPMEFQEEAQSIIQDLIDGLTHIAPENHYFGSHPGDGADFGFWECEDW